MIAAGRLWRSDNITASTDEEIVRLRALGLSTVIDLRAPDEVERSWIATGSGTFTG